MDKDLDYKYLGVLKSNMVENEKVKNLVCGEYKRNLTSTLKSKLNRWNLIKSINTFTFSVVQYTEGIEKCTKNRFKVLTE